MFAGLLSRQVIEKSAVDIFSQLFLEIRVDLVKLLRGLRPTVCSLS